MKQELIVRGVVDGEPGAAEAFVRECQPGVEQTVRASRVPPADAPDVVQDALIEALRQLSRGRFEQRSSLRTWVARIARGKAIDYWRASGRRGLGRLVPLDAVDTGVGRFGTQAAQEARLLVEGALRAMPARLNLVLRLRYREGMAVEEVARRLGLSESRTRNLVTEAQRALREHVCGRGKATVRRRLEGQGT